MGLVLEPEIRAMSMWKARQSRQLKMTEDQYEAENKAVRPTVLVLPYVLPEAVTETGEGE